MSGQMLQLNATLMLQRIPRQLVDRQHHMPCSWLIDACVLACCLSPTVGGRGGVWLGLHPVAAAAASIVSCSILFSACSIARPCHPALLLLQLEDVEVSGSYYIRPLLLLLLRPLYHAAFSHLPAPTLTPA
jgi:hypothetical protein